MSPRTPFERLERRRLLAAAVTSNLDVWTITGSDAGESITINLRAADQRLRAVVDGQVIATRLLRHVRLIEVLGNGGNDVIKIDLHDRDSSLMVWCHGGGGRDWLLGGALNENLGGGSGNDVVDGGRGDDIVKGGTGNDDVSGGDENDWIQGNGGHDTLVGGWGDDRMTGGKGRDQLRGGAGADDVVGGKDDDTIKGGGGADFLAPGGGAANVVFREDPGADEVLSGATDTLENDDVDEPLERVQTQAELRAWLIDQAVAQWRGLLGKPPVVWGWENGAVLTATSANGLVSAFDSAGAPSSPQQDTSDTNTQEPGVDEADIVETDGQYLYLLHNSELLVIDADPAADAKIVSRTAFDGVPTGMFLDGDRLTVISETVGSFRAWGGGAIMPVDFGVATPPKTTVTVLNIADRANPTQVSETTFDGSATASRVIDGRLYLAHTAYLNAPAPRLVKNDDGQDVYETEAAYRAFLEDGEIDKIMPQYTTSGGAGGPVLAPPDVYVRAGERLDATTVTLINLRADEPAPISSTSVIGANGHVYASKNSLYLAGFNWDDAEHTDVLKFGLGIDQVSLQASGRVEGSVLNQFSMDEEGEFFRIASGAQFGDESANRVSVLDQVGDELVLVGKVDDLAKGERIFSARFIGDRAYVVTFRQVDPLFVIDLSDPTAPAVEGELKIPGFSNYLQPIAEDLLIGVGREATDEGIPGDAQVSLFDVSDPANPARIDTFNLGEGTSLAAYEHHAFAYFAAQRVLALPRPDGLTLQLLKVDPSSGFADHGSIEHESSVLRSVRIGGNVFSVGFDAVRVHELEAPENELAVVELPELEFPGGGGVIIE